MTEREVRRALLSQTAYRSCDHEILAILTAPAFSASSGRDRRRRRTLPATIRMRIESWSVTSKSRRSGAHPNTRRMWRGLQPKGSKSAKSAACQKKVPLYWEFI